MNKFLLFIALQSSGVMSLINDERLKLEIIITFIFI